MSATEPTSVTASAPGRVCLLGEHCDWAGGSSLAAPLPMGVTVRATRIAEGLEVETRLEGVALTGRWPAEGEVAPEGGPLRFVPAAAAALARRGVGPTDLRLSITSDLPAGRGFSSSAALSVALLDALARAAGRALDPLALADLAYHVERELLGVACGRLDQLSCALGRPSDHGAREGGGSAVLLRWQGGQAAHVRPVRIHSCFYLVVGAFAAPRDTPGILAALNQAFSGQSSDAAATQATRRALRVFAQEAERSAAHLEAGDAAALGESMNRAQRAYDQELAAHLPALRAPGLRAATAALRDAGALGAKFSGAGGDGSVIGLFADAAAAEAGAGLLRDLGLSAWPTPLA